MAQTDVLFLQRHPRQLMGAMYISSYLKKNGLKTDLIIDSLEIDPIRKIRKINPKVIGIYMLSSDIRWISSVVKGIKKNSSAKIIVGGPHPTICPEIIEQLPIDAICRGDGEIPLLKYATAIKNGKNPKKIEGLWVKRNGKITKNPVSQPVKLDILDYPDHQLYDRYQKFIGQHKSIITGRGCPYGCTYCINNSLKQIFGKAYIRKRSVQDVINELHQIKDEYHAKSIIFLDETFTYDIEWLKELMAAYSQQIKLPFYCATRPEKLNKEIIELMKAAGCSGIEMGIESPFPSIREKIFKRQTDQKELLRVLNHLRKSKIKVMTFNILGIMDDSMKEFKATLEINLKAKVDFPLFQIIKYYPDLEICKLMKPASIGPDFKQKGKRELNNLFFLAYLMYSHPSLLKYSKLLSKLPITELYKIIYFGYYSYYTIKIMGASPLSLIKRALYDIKIVIIAMLKSIMGKSSRIISENIQ